MNRIIEKMVPIVGAIFLISGIAYLIYTNAWIHIPLVGRLALGFILSTAIIGGSFSLSEKLRYFTDLGIGSVVLLLYGTLIYGSRTTDVATAVIPEVATLVTAFIFIAAVSYFASKRNSITVLILGMLGAYMTPFVIGTEHVWAQSISFNTYLIYFAAINVAVFLVGREISIRKIIPLNILSLCIGTSTLYALSYTKGVTQLAKQNFFTGDIFTAILLCVLCIFLTWSVLLSAKQFNEKDEGYLAVGYLAPILWFIYSIGKLDSISDNLEGFLYAILAASCFVGWHILRGYNTKFQHIGLYAAGLLAAFLAFFSFFPDLDIYTSIAIAYLSLIFAGIYFFNPTKWERLIAFGLVSLMGSILSVYHILDAHSAHETVYIVIALIPAMSSYFIAKRGKSELVPLFRLYSVFAVIVALMFILKDLLDYHLSF
jgi:hypothetical protein